MGNTISYTAGGEHFSFTTSLSFDNLSEDQVALKVFLAVSFDRDSNLIDGKIRINLTPEEEKEMSDEDIFELRRITNITFNDYKNNKRLRLQHMSDFQEKFIIETI